jgi:hypothetical protein
MEERAHGGPEAKLAQVEVGSNRGLQALS